LKIPRTGSLPIGRLLGLTVAALLIHGYHFGVEDGEIYLPAAKQLLHPELYLYGREFFLCHGRLSLFGPILEWTAKLSSLSMDWTVFLWYVATLFATLVSCWFFVCACFAGSRARWNAMLLVTAVLAMPATNTGLLLIDPYLTARSFSTPLTLFAIASFLEGRYAQAGAFALAVGAFHPQMVVYPVLLACILWAIERAREAARQPVPAMAAGIAMLPTGFHFARATGAYREALYSRDYFFLFNYTWYHWLGMLAPLAILTWFLKGNVRGTRAPFQRICLALVPFGLMSIAAAAVLCSSPDLDMFARLQPLRSFHLITLLFMLLLGGVAGEYLSGSRRWISGGLFLALALGMFFAARQTYPHSPHIELPSKTSSNPWVATLLWIRQNTPEDAVFAVDSRYFKDDVTDVHGFRAISERSALADYYKDSGVVALFPALAVEWKQMSDATYGLNGFSATQFRRLALAYPAVSWTVIHGPAPAGMSCPYQRESYSVCRMPETVVAALGQHN